MKFSNQNKELNPIFDLLMAKVGGVIIDRDNLREALVRITRINSPDKLGLAKAVRKMRAIAREAVPNYVQLGKKYDRDGKLKKNKERDIWDGGIPIPKSQWPT